MHKVISLAVVMLAVAASGVILLRSEAIGQHEKVAKVYVLIVIAVALTLLSVLVYGTCRDLAFM